MSKNNKNMMTNVFSMQNVVKIIYTKQVLRTNKVKII